MVLQCNLTKKIPRSKDKKTLKLKLYDKDCLLELTENQIESIPEYMPFDILITSDDSEQGFFELPELEDYEIQNLGDYSESNDVNSYSFNQNYCIYGWNDPKSPIDLQTVPLTPGYYTIRIIEDNGQTLFAYWYISPKELTTPEWQVMRDDVEEMVKGLALNYSKKMRSKIKNVDGIHSKGILNDDTAFLVEQETRIRYAIETLRNEAKYQISKSYSWVPTGSKNEIDQQTIRKIGERPDKRGMLYAPHRYLEYNVAANRWLKLFLVRLVKFCGKQIEYNLQIKIVIEDDHKKQTQYTKSWTKSEELHFNNNFTNNLNELQRATNILKKLREYLRLVLEDTFLKNASMPSNTALPKALMLNASYNILYRVYMVLFQHKEQFTLDRSYRRYWKKTAQLYEIWSFINVMKSLIRQNFEPISGWIYDIHGKSMILPFLSEGTQIRFASGKLFINLTYNETIPSNGNKVSTSRPLVTVSNRNKPDIRIDIFDLKERYLGSVLLDAKYKKLIKIFNQVSSSKYNRLRDQLTSYVNDTSSPFYDNYRYIEDMRPVRTLLVLYPTNDLKTENRGKIKYTGRNVQYIQTRPGGSFSELDSVLSENISKIKDRSHIFEMFDFNNLQK